MFRLSQAGLPCLQFGFTFLINNGIITEPILWTTDPKYILGVVIIVQLWMSLGTGFLVFMAGLQNVDSSYYEAAAIDGIRSKLQELWYITLPMMKPQLLFGAINAVVGAFGVFDVLWISDLFGFYFNAC